jgi:hypothetical protein
MQTAVHKLDGPQDVRRGKLGAWGNYVAKGFIILSNIIRMIISRRMGWTCSSNEKEEENLQHSGRTTRRRKATNKT